VTVRAAKWSCEPIRPVHEVSRPDIQMPARACDTHMHAFGPLDRYPSVATPRYDHPGGSLQQYASVAAALAIERMVIVQPSFYGTDNSFLLEALEKVGSPARGVVMLPDTEVAPSTLEELHERGVRGLRLNFFGMHDLGAAKSEYLQALRKAAGLARSIGWHVELYSPGVVIRDLVEHLPEIGVAVSVDHMGYMKTGHGMTDTDFAKFVETVKSGQVWVKLTAPYRLSSDADWLHADDMARALIAAAPERMLWGTDWPHIPDCGLDTGALLARLLRWCPDDGLRTRILVDNPARLYGYM
jgi:2-pyrone-4,6-dicarboxylate lactonase